MSINFKTVAAVTGAVVVAFIAGAAIKKKLSDVKEMIEDETAEAEQCGECICEDCCEDVVENEPVEVVEETEPETNGSEENQQNEVE
jgi:hypothetical protein